jgi:hypothetical protein
MEALSADSRQAGRPAQVARREERGRQLERLLIGADVCLLNDRRVPGSLASIDLLAVGPRGVTVIDASHETGRARVAAGRLLVNGHDRTGMVLDVLRQVEVIRLGLATHPNLPVTGAICWVEPDGLPRLHKLTVQDVHIEGPRALADELRRPGPLSSARVHRIANVLDRRLPPRI